jgi:hypothetical protein
LQGRHAGLQQLAQMNCIGAGVALAKKDASAISVPVLAIRTRSGWRSAMEVA